MTLLELEHVTASPWESLSLQDISLSLDAGDILAVLGPNGAGKSSLLGLMGGSIPLSGGRLSLMGRELTAWSLTEKARIVAMLPQRSTLSFPFAVSDVVMLGRVPHASGIQADQRIVTEALEALGIATLAGRPYPELSGGEQQRVQLARVLCQLWRATDSPGRVLLLDEPAAALDYVHLAMLGTLLRRFAAEGCGIVLVLHDLNAAAALADRVLLLKQGRVWSQGRPREVLSPDALEQVFGVRPIIATHPNSGRPLVIQA